MIITRTPLRISIGGGGTDLPSYYLKYGGFVISAAISRYVFITLNRSFRKNYFIKYAQLETAEDVRSIQHPIIREAFVTHSMGPYIEMDSMADIPSGTGLGSSGSFTVGLLKAIYAYKREHITTQALAEEACHVELNLLKEPIGKQDQYIAAFGGLICMEFNKDGQVTVSPLRIPPNTFHDLEDNLLMFFTGYSRSASNVLKDQKTRTEKEDPQMIENLHMIKELGYSIRTALETGRTDEFARLMNQHWQHKKKRSDGIANQQISDWYDLALENGALGGKLIGAGGGGFLMFYANDRVALRKAMADAGLAEVRFSFDHEGSKILVVD